jgi:hypothetical protein
MTNEDNHDSGNVSWFPYVLVVTAILVIGVVVLSVNGQKPTRPAVATQAADISNVLYKSLTGTDTKEKSISLPHQTSSAAGERFVYNFTLNQKADGSKRYNIIMDDCVEKLVINDKEVKLEGDALINRCNWETGFVIDLRDYLKEGANKVTLEGKNGDGPSGLNILVK